MTSVLHLPARSGAPVACDMSTASDTLDERVAEYRELFARGLARRERREAAVVLAFRPPAGTREHVEDIARREALCCPFLDYRVETTPDEVIYTVTNPGRPQADVILDGLYALAAGSGGSELGGLLAQAPGGPPSSVTETTR